MQSITRASPTTEHIGVWRKSARMLANEELVSWRANHEWLVILADAEADEWPDVVTANSYENALAVIAAVDAELTWRASKGIEKPVSPLGWPRDFLDALKASVRIEDEIGKAIHLTRRGKVLRGCCPFHDSRSKLSLVVFPDDGGWWCFGCQVGGDVFVWLQAYERLTFRESVEYLAVVAGMKVPKPPKPATGRDAVPTSFDYVAGKVVAR